MDRRISRRHFIDGVAVAAAGAALGPRHAVPPAAGQAAAPGRAASPGRAVPHALPHAGHVPSARHAASRARRPSRARNLQGDTPDAVGVPHALRDGRFWERAGAPRPTGETYDLVVVGAGISGVTAAYAWAERDRGARVLVLDNYDDIGGHARRNEFRPAGRSGPLVGHGGARSLYAPSAWSPEGRGLLASLGVEVRGRRPDLYRSLGMREGVFCDRETFSADRLVVPDGPARRWVAELPVAARAREDLIRLLEDPPDWFPGLTDARKKEVLAGLTYTGFLREVCRAHPDVIAFCRTMPSAAWGYGADALGALDAWAESGPHAYPGFAGLRLDRSRPSPYNAARVARRWAAEDGDVPCFPEGNQALVRMMVARLVPGFAGSAAVEDITTTWFDYGALDRPANRVRFRLSSPVVLVRNDGPAETASSATVGYYDGGRVRTVRAGAVVMACWNMVIPYLLEDLPAEQKEAMRQAVKMPLVHATAQLRGWRAFREAGVHRVRFTGAYWVTAELAPPVSAGAYRCPSHPDEPIAVHLLHTPARRGLAPREAAVAGRRELLRTPYAPLEFGVREQLTRLLGPFGFDPARDIEGLTINRWGHGYAPEYVRPWDAFHPGGPFPAELARRRFGRVAIANSDSVPGADVDSAVRAAYRAVDELAPLSGPLGAA
ncbi:FAD-dependent oxidoreductase [Sphaerisporangium krabiense]|uniref:Spermidine dehydrogenase n=1 Tax=Sphaerisporangium krabiense TaxID=763782 RepID=A0A7W8Z1L7_9ACTN|nr:FAD-dependent oxidoreductase [Sphaerisporangium krabiense]MBB5625736.1 spermidine dehydrogenase [Sphaerisporangium krabiense]